MSRKTLVTRIAAVIVTIGAIASTAFAQGMMNGAQEPISSNLPSNVRPSGLKDVAIEQRLNEQIPADVTFRDETGKTVRLGDYFGKRPVILNLAYYTCASGTSMASPHVVGTVALMQQAAGGKLTPDQIKKVLEQTARPMTKNDGSSFAVWEVGAGYMDAYAAVLAVMP